MSIQFVDLKKQFKVIEADVRKRLDTVFEHARFIMGPEVNELEEQLAAFVGVKHAISCSSGTDALLLPLMAYGIGPGDAVFTTPFTFIATAEVIALLGATSVFVDIDPETLNIDPELLKTEIIKVKEEGKLNPKGIITVDLFGLPADYDRIESIAREDGLFVLEDGAESFGGEMNGRRVGSFGNVAATSFFPAKMLGCYGDGGAIFTDDDDLAKIMRSIRVHGQGENKYDNIRIGVNGRLDTMQAAVLLSKLEIFPDEIKERQRVANAYSELLSDYVKIPSVPENYKHAWGYYSIQSDIRDQIMEKLNEAGIPSVIYFPKPLHLQDAFKNLGYKHGDFMVSEETSGKIFSLPMHPYLTEDEIIKIANAVIDGIKKTG